MRLAPVPFLFLLVTGCAAVAPEVPVAPAAPPAAATASTPATRQPAPPASPPAHAAATEKKAVVPGTETPAAASRPPSAPATAVRPAAPASAAPPQAASAPLDLNALKEQLKETRAIGVMTKLFLKSQVDDLLQQFRDFYQGKARVTLPQLRRSYDLLLMKVLSLVQDADRPLAASIVASREAIWGLLSDPKKFSTLEG